jgi:Bifunctional DNA primase/polymerase, N-terminal
MNDHHRTRVDAAGGIGSAANATRALNDALTLASMGLACFPCTPSKRPACRHGFHDATTNPAELRGLWARSPGNLVGVRTGDASGIDVLDVDPKHQEAFEWSKAHHKQLPKTRVHKTRSGGVHVLFRHAPGLRCSASRIARGIDVRANGGYIIWWPATGLRVLRAAPLADWPQWLLDRLMSSPHAAPPAPRIVIPDTHALAKLVRLVAAAPEGERNALTYWAACRAGEMVASGLLDAESATAVIAEAAISAGLTRSEAERTARSGVRKTSGGTGA